MHKKTLVREKSGSIKWVRTSFNWYVQNWHKVVKKYYLMSEFLEYIRDNADDVDPLGQKVGLDYNTFGKRK